MKNNIQKGFYLVLSVAVVLLLISFIPKFKIGNKEFKRVDLLSDLKVSDGGDIDNPDGTDSTFVDDGGGTVVTDSASVVEPEKELVTVQLGQLTPNGTIRIEDYGPMERNGLNGFVWSLKQIGLKKNVRIAYYGDSFIEGDILTGSLRDLLRERFGGKGVGYVDITSQVSGFRVTVKHKYGNWNSFAATERSGFDASKQGIAARYFTNAGNAFVELKGSKNGVALDRADKSTIYFVSRSNAVIASSINGEPQEKHQIEGSESLQHITVEGDIESIRWSVLSAPNAIFYGVTMDGTEGVVLDNLSMRSSSGYHLKGIPEQRLQEFNKARHYDLIVLEYGLNVAGKNQKNYSTYKKNMIATIEHLKSAFPNTSFMLVSVSDRDYRASDGQMHTMPGVKALVEAQREIAQECGIAFWDLYTAMGGDGSMAAMAKKGMANKDYTHINSKGGKKIAELFYDAIMYEVER
ncbi:MAG: SGNH/GDSL hydrolase family protein [Bacteroidales bacterium]|nr:SGNH/GDSL hydrolase family protein [Bacteroidales bacterium]